MSFCINKKDFFWGYAAQFLNIGAGVLLLPVLLRTLSPADVGLWFVFVTLSTLVQLLEFGFLPTLSRNVAYVCSGAKKLLKEGLPSQDDATEGVVDRELLSALLKASRWIYRWITLAVAFVMLVLGTGYISTLLLPEQSFQQAAIAWGLFATGYIVNFYFGYVAAFLQGGGAVGQVNKAIVIARIILIVLGSVLVACGFGLLGLGIASLLSSVVSRVISLRWLNTHELFKNLPEMSHGASALIKNLLKIVWHNASRLGVVQFGGFLIQRGNVLIASSVLGLEMSASYSVCVTVLMALSAVSGVICQVQLPYVSALQLQGKKDQLGPVYGEMILGSLLLYVIGFLFLLFFGNSLLHLLGSKVLLLSGGAFLLMGCMLLLELNHSIAATYLTTMNQVPFVKASVLSGLCILCLSLLLVRPFGVLGLLFAQAGVQALYNNWKWPMEVFRLLGVDVFSCFLSGGKRLVARFR